MKQSRYPSTTADEECTSRKPLYKRYTMSVDGLDLTLFRYIIFTRSLSSI